MAQLRLRVRAAKEASNIARKIETTESDLLQLKEMIDSTVHVQLGALLVRRGVNVSEIVGSYAVASCTSPSA